jgi:Zn-dependent M28 family amino/carboxypeptidase
VSTAPADEATLREVVASLAPLERGAGTDGERAAAELLAARLENAGCEVVLQEEEFLDGYARLLARLTAASAVAGVARVVVPRTRWLPGAVAIGAAGAIADDVSNGPRLFRRAVAQRLRTSNVVATCGDRDSTRTLVVVAHHDAGHGGKVFDDSLQAWLGERIPGIVERIDTSLPLWWLVLSGPLLVAFGAATGRRAALVTGTVGSAVAAAAFEDIARSQIVPGANDNLSGVAALVLLAERLGSLRGLRVLLVSCGAEEVLQGGIHGFAQRWFASLDREQTWFLNLDTVGSPELILLEGEGPLVVEDYFDRSFRDLVARAAAAAGAPIRRGMRSRLSTDAVVPSRAGYPTATLTSMDRYKSLSNYHKMSDTSENLDYRTVRQAATVAEAVAQELATNPWIGRAL